MPRTALLTLDLRDLSVDECYDDVGDDTTFAATILKIFADLQIDSHIRDACQNRNSLAASQSSKWSVPCRDLPATRT